MHFQTFKYRKSIRIPYRNCYFHSSLELKSALSIEQDFRYLREPVLIGYDARTLTTTDYFREDTRLYKPDFLVRCKTTGEAQLIEIKPDQLKNSSESRIYSTIVNDYIRRHKVNYNFHIISEIDIHLNAEQKARYAQFLKYRLRFEGIFAFKDLDKKCNGQSNKYFSSVPSFPEDELNKTDYAKFVRHGSRPKAVQ